MRNETRACEKSIRHGYKYTLCLLLSYVIVAIATPIALAPSNIGAFPASKCFSITFSSELREWEVETERRMNANWAKCIYAMNTIKYLQEAINVKWATKIDRRNAL